ncbi:integrase-like protein [Dysgonomonas alginatilytica]|uniref:Integrase-like protein n=1 Tax=Dysgonomonas alginatilytica TaxID=1605892 RepID=A0A2V3PL74_9BACT|nr:transposase [Dysgonomonas alginatilytica]PXV62337.1 integrase-like protein [Dysgonomonas alginatilytica]
MATFKALVQKKRSDNTYVVYIRCTHNRSIKYIKTDLYVHERKIKGGEIIDQTILGQCAIKIKGYLDKLNNADNVNRWSVNDIVDFLTTEQTDIPFIPFCKSFIEEMRKENRGRSATNYMCALNSFVRHSGNNVTFQEINSIELTNWIKSLGDMKRAKESYPKYLKTMFDAGCSEYNDYNRNIIRIPSRPFTGVKIPKHDVAPKKAIDASVIKSILEFEAITEQTKKARDIAKLVFYLVGINTVDLFNLKHSNYINGKICYNRSKTKDSRTDKAYIEITVHPDILYLFEIYKGEERLFDFGYCNARSFNKQINIGLKTISDTLGIPQVGTYTFRHSWATIAYIDCGASIDSVALCLNHISAHKVTRLYVKDIFKPIEVLNSEVIDFVFGRKKVGKKKKKVDVKELELVG